jgi:hypothetical protein
MDGDSGLASVGSTFAHHGRTAIESLESIDDIAPTSSAEYCRPKRAFAFATRTINSCTLPRPGSAIISSEVRPTAAAASGLRQARPDMPRTILGLRAKQELDPAPPYGLRRRHSSSVTQRYQGLGGRVCVLSRPARAFHPPSASYMAARAVDRGASTEPSAPAQESLKS